MASFKGQAEYSVDAKGRVAIPAKMRNELTDAAGNTFVITRGFGKYVLLYPRDYWENSIEAKFSGLNMFNSNSRELARGMMRWAEEATLDAQGRVMIPKSLLTYAGISDRVTIIGAFDSIEIWDPAEFEQHDSSQQESYEQLAERVMTSS